jgi:hypothetical protein
MICTEVDQRDMRRMRKQPPRLKYQSQIDQTPFAIKVEGMNVFAIEVWVIWTTSYCYATDFLR